MREEGVPRLHTGGWYARATLVTARGIGFFFLGVHDYVDSRFRIVGVNVEGSSGNDEKDRYGQLRIRA